MNEYPDCPTCGENPCGSFLVSRYCDGAARRHRAHRAALVRAVLAQQWAVAVALEMCAPPLDRNASQYRAGLFDGFHRAECALFDLPCADDVVPR